jgi:methylated-DNA-[protein]-cysteine S-methyltransferase
VASVFSEVMTTPSFAIVETADGAFGVAWSEAGIVRTWMHDRTIELTRSQIRRAFPGAEERVPPASIAATVAGVASLLAGQGRAAIPGTLDMRAVPEFDRRVYDLARTIPPGETITYGAIARALGEEPLRARDVGVAMARNRFAPIVPCHRVIAAGGKLGGYSAPGGEATKRRLLELEGAAIVADRPHQQALFEIA